MQVLIVEDDSQTRQLLQHALTEAGFNVVAAEHGGPAWELLKTGTIRLAIVDSDVPGIDGNDLCRRLVESPKTNGVYVIMLANAWETDAMVALLDSGASDYLAKPFKPGELVARVRVGSRLVDLQSQLSQAQKLESIGQLAAGVAHEINTPIQYIGDNLQFLSDTLQELIPWLDNRGNCQTGSNNEQPVDWDYLKDELPSATEQSLQGIRHVARIVSAMKGFSHMGTKDYRAVDIRNVIHDAREVSRNQCKYVCDVEVDFPDDWPEIFCLQGEINQVFLNLIINAAHAIEDCFMKTGKRGLIQIHGRQVQDQIQVDIRDTGGGIPQEIQDRIFDPFFTTKEVGRGTGQGLAMVHSIVTQHHGTVSFETTPGEGTTFTITLPIHRWGSEDSEDDSEIDSVLYS